FAETSHRWKLSSQRHRAAEKRGALKPKRRLEAGVTRQDQGVCGSAGVRRPEIFFPRLDATASGGNKLFERHVVEDGSDRIAHFRHRTTHLTALRIGTAVAALLA